MKAMKKYFLYLFLILLVTNNNYSQNNMEKKLKEFFKKDEVTILITDSGLGGLSVTAKIDELLNRHKSFKKARIVFFNSQPEDSIGYNGMKTRERKLEVFNSALEGMVKGFNPDIILIACNTLSVIYDDTKFAAKESIPPVIGIVDFGVDMIYSKLKRNKNSSAVIFGTETTISANTHKQKLISKGINEERIITQACKNLPGAIEDGAESEKTGKLITKYIDSSFLKISDKSQKVFLGLCCTHFGYSKNLFFEKSSAIKKREVLDPNILMSEFVINKKKSYKNAETSVEVFSRADLSDLEINSIGGLIKKSSPKTERALKNYQLKKDLFEFKP